MKRRDAITILQSIVQDWDGCMINRKAARQILTRIENEIGMVPPGKWVESKLFGQSYKHDWDQPKKRKKK